VLLVFVLLLAGGLRLANLTKSPPGLNQDEAANAWNAYCLLKTGQDQHGVRWPIFYSRCLGGNRSTLFLYILLPFQALGGLNVWTTRLPVAVGGLLAVVLTYWVGTRLFGRSVGLAAAALLAVNPWHLQQSRWGHEGALCPLLALAPLAMLLWANLIPVDQQQRRPRLIVATLAGLLTGICCYGYPAVRLFIPVFLVLTFLASWNGWRVAPQLRRRIVALCLFSVALGATLGPLGWKHITDPDGIAKRGQTTLFWKGPQPLETVAANIAGRYRDHFGPDFLFVRGDHYELQSPPDAGQFHWYMLPVMLVGLGTVIRQLKHSRAARVLLVWVLMYPVGDTLGWHIAGSAHALRSGPGLCGLVLLAAVGAVNAGRWLRGRKPPLAWAAASIFLATALLLNVRYLHRFFGEFNTRPNIYRAYHVDLLKACEWLRPRLDELDAVFCTTLDMRLPYAVSLVGLGYDPQTWFDGPREFVTPGEWDLYTRYGKIHFVYAGSAAPALNELKRNERPDRVALIFRPRETPLDWTVRPAHTIHGPDGQPALLIYELQL